MRADALTPALSRRERGKTNSTRRPGKRSANGRKEFKVSQLPPPEYSRNMRLIGHSDQGGRPDGVQLMVHRGFAYIGHMVSQGFSIVDVRDPKNPKAAGYVPAPPGTERAPAGA